MEDQINYIYEPSFDNLSVNRTLAIIYQQGLDYSEKSASLAMFIACLNVDIKSIIAFKKEVQADYLIAIVTDNVEYPCLAIANRFIYCNAADVTDLAQALKMMSGEKTFISIDANDIKLCFTGRNTASFVSFRTTLHNFQQDLPKYQIKLKQETQNSKDSEYLITHVSCSENFNFDEQEKITEVNNSVFGKHLSTFYSIAFTDDTTDCHIANLIFWHDENRPQVLSTRVNNQLPSSTDRLDVSLQSLLVNKKFSVANNALHLFMGSQYPKQVTFLNLIDAPHLLMAGLSKVTSYKMLHTLMVSILMQYSPEQVRLMLIDSEKPVFTDYQNLPHLISPINNRENAIQSLAWCQLEMERRFNLMRQTSTRSIVDLNQKIEEANKVSLLLDSYRVADNLYIESEQICALLQPLPTIVIVVSELKELMQDGTLPNERLITNLVIKARAAGIHLILSTNYPSADVITDLIKINIPTRLSFAVNTIADSSTILDKEGAEMLTDEAILFLPSYSEEPKYLQPIFATQTEISQACEQWQFYKKVNHVVTQSDEIAELIETNKLNIPKRFYELSQPDSMYDDVVNYIRATNTVSASAIQRKFNIGYNRIRRLVERMEAEKIVTSKSRKGKRTLL